MSKMRFLVISDGHGDLDVLDKLDSEFNSCDAVLFGGDFAKFKEPETGLPFLQKLVKKHDCIYSVLGNCDEPEFLETIENYDISVQKSLTFGSSFTFLGFLLFFLVFSLDFINTCATNTKTVVRQFLYSYSKKLFRNIHDF